MTEMNEEIQKQISLVWAKSNRENPEETHLLLYHLIESAAVGLALWQCAFSDSIKREYAEMFQMPLEDFGKLLAYWIGLHDVGKASPIFQSAIETKNPSLVNAIRDAGLRIEKNLKAPPYHSQISGKFLHQHQLVPPEVEIAITGHHGTWNTYYKSIIERSYGDQTWDNLRMEYCEILREVLGISHVDASTFTDVEQANVFTVWFSGLICVADWISSDDSYFEYCNVLHDPAFYFKNALKKAKERLAQLGWIGWRSHGDLLTFKEMYSGWEPRPIQKRAITAFSTFSPAEPFLMIVEAPTGIGKTEIAMYLADRWLQQSGGSGMYIAMPTQATSNQLYSRSLDVLAKRYPDEKKINIVLAHGQARWNEEVNNIRVKEVGEASEGQSLIAAEWFQNNRKRTLLAPFGVGTVDQVFLSILQTKHFFVRLFGLKNKVIIFDEVHAYDTYMNVLFHRLLEWLHSLGVSVIILSATLPDKTRKEITSHYCGIPVEQVPDNHDYPRVTLANSGRDPVTTHLVWEEKDREIAIHWAEEDDLGKLLEERLSGGGCAAVICNTVRQSQEIYQQLEERSIVTKENLILFHARFPFIWRKEIEEKVLDKFGKESTLKNGNRPKKAIVVATQVIEQSLDLDFDFMVTELAPVDLILQRAGRLHRHDRGTSRPKKLQSPELVIVDVETNEQEIPVVGRREPFYPKSILLKTYYQFKPIKSLKVVSVTRELIEAVYQSDIDPETYPKIAYQQMQEWIHVEESEESVKIDTAGFTVIGSPDYKRLLKKVTKKLVDDDNAKVIEQLRAKTRDGGISIRLPCVFTNDSGDLFYNEECQEKSIINKKQGYSYLKKRLSQNEISISHIGLIDSILREGDDLKDTFSQLHSQKVLKFSNGVAVVGKFTLNLSRRLGLMYKYGG